MARYDQRLGELELWLQRHRLGSLRALSQSDDRAVNAVLTARLQQMANDQLPLSHGADLISAFMKKRFPWFRGRMAESWHSFAVWSRASPHVTRLGLDYVLHRAMLALCVLWKSPLTAASLAAGFHGLLRPGEIAAMLRSHIRLPSDGVGLDGRPKAIICIIKGKTRHRAARVESVVDHDAEVVRLLEVVLHGVSHTTALLPGGTAGLRLRFAELLSALRVSHIAYSPASLRPGGALHVFAAGNVSLTSCTAGAGTVRRLCPTTCRRASRPWPLCWCRRQPL